LVGAAAVAAGVVIAVARGWWWRVRLRWVVVTSSIGAAAFAVLLALTDGADGVLRGAAHETEFLVNLPVTPPAAEFLRTFVDRIGDYSVHVRGHPPGFVLALKALDAVHLGGDWATAALSIVATAAAPAGVLVAVWAVAGAPWVRRTAPVLIVTPYALWMVTSADAVYTAVGAWAVALLAVGLRPRGPIRIVTAAAAGLLLGLLLFLTYGGAVFLAVPLVLAVAELRRSPALALTAAGTTMAALGTVFAAFAGFGFWWFAGAAATRVEYWAGTARLRTWDYFAVANIAVALIRARAADAGRVDPAARPPGVAAGRRGAARADRRPPLAVQQGRGRTDLAAVLPVDRRGWRRARRREGAFGDLGRRPGGDRHRPASGPRVEMVIAPSGHLDPRRPTASHLEGR